MGLFGRARCSATAPALFTATLLAGTAASAGGFDRGVAPTDLIYSPETFSAVASVTHVAPKRGFESIAGQDGGFGDYSESYTFPTLGLAVSGDILGCAGTYTEPFGGDADYTGSPGGALPMQVSSTQGSSTEDRWDFANATTVSRTRTLSFETHEFGLTCRASYKADIGRFSLIGGVFAEDFRFEGSSFAVSGLATGTPSGPFPALSTRIDVESEGSFKPGYRIGAAFEKPEIALRLQALYKSEVDHDDIEGKGTVTVLESLAGLGLPPAGTVVPVASRLSDALSPQSLTITAQSGIAPGWLALASFNWTDWSTNEAAVSSIENLAAGVASSSFVPYHWRDGYSGSLGIGHQFSGTLAGAAQLGYERGVSTGSETTYTDLYTLGAGIEWSPTEKVKLGVAGFGGYWTGGEQSTGDGAYFDAEVGDDAIYGGNVAISVSF